MSHKLVIRSSYGAEALSASHGIGDSYPTIITTHDIKYGTMGAAQLKHIREAGGLRMKIYLTIDAESVHKSLTSSELKTPTENSMLGHISGIRELLQLRIIQMIQWCDTRDMTANGHTNGCIDRKLLLDLMSGIQQFSHNLKTFKPPLLDYHK